MHISFVWRIVLSIIVLLSTSLQLSRTFAQNAEMPSSMLKRKPENYSLEQTETFVTVQRIIDTEQPWFYCLTKNCNIPYTTELRNGGIQNRPLKQSWKKVGLNGQKRNNNLSLLQRKDVLIFMLFMLSHENIGKLCVWKLTNVFKAISKSEPMASLHWCSRKSSYLSNCKCLKI